MPSWKPTGKRLSEALGRTHALRGERLSLDTDCMTRMQLLDDVFESNDIGHHSPVTVRSIRNVAEEQHGVLPKTDLMVSGEKRSMSSNEAM